MNVNHLSISLAISIQPYAFLLHLEGPPPKSIILNCFTSLTLYLYYYLGNTPSTAYTAISYGSFMGFLTAQDKG